MERKRFFISHSSKDKDMVELFVNSILVTGLQISYEEIYCSSMSGLGNKSGDDFVEEISKALSSADISILIITESYRDSEICLNEMGAAWLSKSHVIPIIVEPISYTKVGPLNLQKHCEKMLSSDSIDNVKITIESKTKIDSTKTNRWNSIVKKFIEDAKKIKIEKSKIVSLETHQKLLKDHKGLQDEFDEISRELDQLKGYIKILEAKKDKASIKKAKKEAGISGFEEEFKEKKDAVVEAIQSFNRITSRILLCNHYGHKHPNLDGYWDDVEDAQRKKFLTEDECQTGRKNANVILTNALNDIDQLSAEEAFCDWYREEYNEDFDTSDEEFWNEFYF